MKFFFVVFFLPVFTVINDAISWIHKLPIRPIRPHPWCIVRIQSIKCHHCQDQTSINYSTNLYFIILGLAQPRPYQKQSCWGICSDSLPWRHMLHPAEPGHLDNHRSFGNQGNPSTLCHHGSQNRNEGKVFHKAILPFLHHSLQKAERSDSHW